MDWQPTFDLTTLAARAELFAAIRSFFAQRQVLEVDTPTLSRYGVSDPAIEPLTTSGPESRPRFLQTSPEFAMKRLLAAGSGPIYQLGKVFRAYEEGARHNPEFALLEWYRPGFTLDDLMDEVAALVRQCNPLAGAVSEIRLTYREVFEMATSLNPHTADVAELIAVSGTFTDTNGLDLDRDAWLDLLMTHAVEPALRGRGMVFVYAYPPSQAALARCIDSGDGPVAERFELYLDGIELANGYRELLDPEILEQRADSDNQARRNAGQEERALDPRLVAAMKAGLPDCSGVALGVDRLLMATLGLDSIGETMPFSWDRA